jgi:hypothetical protein
MGVQNKARYEPPMPVISEEHFLLVYRHSTYAIGMYWKMWPMSNSAQVRADYTYSWNQSSTCQNLISDSMSVPLPVIAQQYSPATLISHWKIWHMFFNYLIIPTFTLKKCISKKPQNLKLHKLNSVCELKHRTHCSVHICILSSSFTKTVHGWWFHSLNILLTIHFNPLSPNDIKALCSQPFKN